VGDGPFGGVKRNPSHQGMTKIERRPESHDGRIGECLCFKRLMQISEKLHSFRRTGGGGGGFPVGANRAEKSGWWNYTRRDARRRATTDKDALGQAREKRIAKRVTKQGKDHAKAFDVEVSGKKCSSGDLGQGTVNARIVLF